MNFAEFYLNAKVGLKFLIEESPGNEFEITSINELRPKEIQATATLFGVPIRIFLNGLDNCCLSRTFKTFNLLT